jgi:Flp pilus assembly protein TadD
LLRPHKFLPALWLLCLLAACAGPVWAQGSEYQSAMNLVQKREFDQAISLLQQILDRSPNDLKARNLLGIALSGAGKREEANEQFNKALALDPQFVPALKNLAVNELALGQHRDARLHFEAALKVMPRDPACHWGLAEIAFAARRTRFRARSGSL